MLEPIKGACFPWLFVTPADRRTSGVFGGTSQHRGAERGTELSHARGSISHPWLCKAQLLSAGAAPVKNAQQH